MAWGIGLARLSDNSFFTHLATGRLILDTGHIPTVDPYSFTARGEPWVVQSWLASLLYGVTEDVFGGGGLRVLMALLVVATFAVAWRLTKTAESFLVRLAVGGAVVAVGSGAWAERPFLIGLLALGLTMLAAEDDLDPRWLIPIGWIWVNSHGSFPLGIAYLVVVIIGARLDGTPSVVEQRALRWLAGGTALGALNPLGPRLLLFPLELLQRQDVLKYVNEWQAPRFTSMSQRLFLVELAIAVLALVRRPSYRSGLVVAVFMGAALLGSRNVTVTSLVLVPVLASAWPRVGSLRSADRGPLAAGLAAASVAMIALLTVSRLDEPDFDFKSYPVESLSYLQDQEVDLSETRMAYPDMVGNLRELLAGERANVFYDDRFDMYPEAATDAHIALFSASEDWEEHLDRYDIELALLRRSDALTQTLEVHPDWRRLEREDGWALFCHRGAELGGRLDTC